MICVEIDTERGVLDVSGHAGYAAPGTDIVCAGASALAYALARYAGGAEVESGHMRINAENMDERMHGAFSCTLMGYELLEEAYPEHMRLVWVNGRG